MTSSASLFSIATDDEDDGDDVVFDTSFLSLNATAVPSKRAGARASVPLLRRPPNFSFPIVTIAQATGDGGDDDNSAAGGGNDDLPSTQEFANRFANLRRPEEHTKDERMSERTEE